jgi:putative thioredoxin
VALAGLLVDQGENEEALVLLGRVPETDPVRHVAARARLADKPTDDFDTKLAGLLGRVKADDDARQEFLDILELMGPDDPRTAAYRKQLTTRLF